MILLTHIIIALASVIFSTYLFVAPSKSKLKLSYGLIGLTVASGTYLILTQPVDVVHLCIAGLTYTAFSVLVTLVAARKLAALKN